MNITTILGMLLFLALVAGMSRVRSVVIGCTDLGEHEDAQAKVDDRKLIREIEAWREGK